jgi:hypothetical protein
MTWLRTDARLESGKKYYWLLRSWRVRMNTDHYTYRVIWSQEDGEHVGLCAEFPSLSWLAKTSDGALTGIRKLVEKVVADMSADDFDDLHYPFKATV